MDIPTSPLLGAGEPFIPHAKSCHALVIGNSAYESPWTPLLNSKNDAEEMTKLFQSFGMQVETLINREKATIESEFKKLKKHSQEIYKLGEKTFIAVYYSGHGILEGGHTIAVSTNHSSNPHVNIEKEVRTLARMANVFVFGFFDCCREVGQDTKGGPKKEAVEGQLLIVFAAPPNAASKSDPRESTSIATGSFLRFMQTQNFLVLPQSVTEWKARSRHTSAVHQVEIVQGCSMTATFNKTTTKTHPSTPTTTTTSTTTRAIPAVPVPSPQTDNQLPALVAAWQPEHVITWLARLKLSKDYSEIVLGDGVDGTALELIVLEDQWETFGFTAKADILKIKSGLKKLSQ